MPYKNRGRWMAQIKKNNKKIRKRFPTKAEAIAWEVEQRKGDPQQRPQSVSQEKILPQTPTISLIEWATKYLDFAEIKFTNKTYGEKRSAFKKLFQSVDSSSPAPGVSPGLVLAHLQSQVATRSGNAANKDRKNLVAAWNWGMKYLGLPSPNPCLVERFPEERHERYVPSEKDFWRVYDVAESEQDQVMLLAYLHLAARKTELFKLQWKDVDFADSKVRLYTRKRRDGSLEFDWLPTTDSLYDALLKHRQSQANQYVFPDPDTGEPYVARYQWMKRLCGKAAVKPFGLHGIRHLTASILARENVSMLDIQTILRHKNLATTERYIRRLDSIRPVLSVLPGRGPTKGPQNEKRAHGKPGAQLTLLSVTS